MMKHRKFQKLLMVMSVAALAACSQEASQSNALAESLANAEYPLAISPSGKVKLLHGFYQEQAAPDSHTKHKVALVFEKTAWGDLNQDGLQDAAAILLSDGGGSGMFYYLAAALNNAEALQPSDVILLGDRIEVNSVEIDAEGKITVELLTRAENEPMTAVPSVITHIEFKLENNALFKVGE